ncbi:MAG: GCN5-related N-acetyltransferase [Solirubrobacterales bacterium]|nr:GCN5-related N-acetyltransferase [Solirubrobacterales bacterium]
MHVRPVTAEDFRAVCGLLAELGRPAVADSAADGCRSAFLADLADDGADHLIAVEDRGAPVGFLSLHYRRRLNHATPEAWVPDLIVNERARGTGVGRALLAEAERRARERGCHRLALESGYSRTRAHGVYVAAGMTDGGKFFTKELR